MRGWNDVFTVALQLAVHFAVYFENWSKIYKKIKLAKQKCMHQIHSHLLIQRRYSDK